LPIIRKDISNFACSINFVSTLPTLPNLQRSQIIPKVSPTLATLPIIRKVKSQLCQPCLGSELGPLL
tara:strand:- start:50 stop:250 length:201 start_codon:yes stop_codon:yes gene_type:complete